MNFPSSPSLNQTYTFEGKTWKWNGAGWQIVLASGVAWDLVSGKPLEFTPEDHTHTQTEVTGLTDALNAKQATLVSGTNLKTVNSTTLLGSGNIAITKSDVDLANVDNTSDANKPISTATQTALNAKAPSASPTFTGAIANNGSVTGNVVTVGAGTTLDCSLGNFFNKTMSAAWTPTISNLPTEGVFGFVLQLAYSSGVFTLPSGWLWADGVAPTLTNGVWFFTWISGDTSVKVVTARKWGA